MNGPEDAVPPPTEPVSAAAAVFEHDASFGPKSVKVTVPVGLEPPASVAVSEIAPAPNVTPADACVEIVGEALPTATDSFGSLHEPLTAALFASPG